MSIVITIIAIVAGGGMAVFMGSLQRVQIQDTYEKMRVLQEALYQYRVAFNRLPCPADITAAPDSQFFGLEAENQGDCDGEPAANFSYGSSNESPHGGMVPTKSLRLSDDYAFDGWGRRIIYAVSREMTKDNAFTDINPNDLAERIKIMDASGNRKSEVAVYVLLSVGANGHGGYSRFGGASRVNALSINADELENCDCDVNGFDSGFDDVFVQRDPAQAFLVSRNIYDDVLVYETRNGLRSVGE